VDPNANNVSTEDLILYSKQVKDNHKLNNNTNTNETVRTQGMRQTGFKDTCDWTPRNETQVDTMRAGLAITQKETIRNRTDKHRDGKCRETEDTRDRDFKIRHKNSGS